MMVTAGRHGARAGWGGILDRYLFVSVALRLVAVTTIILVILRLGVPFAIAFLVSGLILADRLEWRPARKRALDSVYSDLRSAVFGLPLPVGEAVPLGNLTTLFASGAGDGAGLTGVVVQRAGHVFIASAARFARNRNGEVVLTLAHDTRLFQLDGGKVRRVSFESMRITGRSPVIDMARSDFRHRLDRAAPCELLSLAGGPNGSAGNAAAMVLVMRIDAALLCLLILWIGSVLAIPAPRQRSAVGIW